MSPHATRLPIVGLAALLVACSPLQAPADAPAARAAAAETIRGWYVQDQAGATLQPCGASSLSVVDGSELRRRAEDFGLQDALPVYVVVRGARTAEGVRVAEVTQFGSPSPVRDCPMTGTTIQ